ncbi:MAG: MmcQ/YjbR family DNA-binding protein [Sphingomonadales bacterium]|nr:MmcQ/YjbR family DNA-binding protein [Sphingomonadales bacterium]MDE2169121.1 MmcQ/YjbR family DNA-binding protein [Sphingomonadales bacterium]
MTLPPPALIAPLRAAALALPEVVEATHFHDAPSFLLRRACFALWQPDAGEKDGGRAIMRLDRGLQMIRFEARPEVFAPARVATVHWSYVRLSATEPGEIETLVREAWASLAPLYLRRQAGLA